MKKAFQFFTSPYCLIFCCGFLSALEIYFYQENKYEIQLFESLAKDTREGASAYKDSLPFTDAMFISATKLTHELVQNRMNRFTGLDQQSSFKAMLQPVSYDLMTGNGACGSNSYVLARLLMQLGYPVRIAQMGFQQGNGRHIITEAWNGEKWVVLDALYNLHFRKFDGKLASFADISSNWSYYKAQVPSNYNPQYNYYSVRYANWHKIPILFPVIRNILDFTIGKEKTNNICLRKFYIRKYQVLMQINMGFLFVFVFLTFRKLLYLKKARLQVAG
jgi:hypothetical protein